MSDIEKFSHGLSDKDLGRDIEGEKFRYREYQQQTKEKQETYTPGELRLLDLGLMDTKKISCRPRRKWYRRTV